jgi:hypothetical protein
MVPVIRALVVGVLGLVLGSLQPSVAFAAIPDFLHLYSYDTAHHDPATNYTSTERRPPTHVSGAISHHTVDREAHGSSSRLDPATPSAATTYDDHVTHPRVARAARTTMAQVEAADGVPTSPARWHAATNAGPSIWANVKAWSGREYKLGQTSDSPRLAIELGTRPAATPTTTEEWSMTPARRCRDRGSGRIVLGTRSQPTRASGSRF